MTHRSAPVTEDLETLTAAYERQRANRLALDLTRGKPAPDQLDLSAGLDAVLAGDYRSRNGEDCRNYGLLRGIYEARELGAELLAVEADDVIAFGSSSLTLMYHCTDLSLNYGLWQDQRRWRRADPIRMLAPVPGYDRHFTLSERCGIELVPVTMLASGPSMADATRLAASDPNLKGIWCVPRYANPTGCVYDPATVDAIARLPIAAAADDFVVFWDNAYAVHHLTDEPEPLASIKAAARAAGTEDHILQFASTSKITYAGAGIAFVAASSRVLDALEAHLSYLAIGSDKVNQLRHARFLHGRVADHMRAHAALLRPKFELVERQLREGLAGWPIAQWTTPGGGYFVSIDTQPGLARRVVELAAAAGLKLTSAGATFPYGKDPDDRNIRIAPSFANIDELQAAMALFVVCLKLAHLERSAPQPIEISL